MATDKQVRANQQNAQKSTGPTSAAGKLKVSGNRISHGILSKKLLLSGECAKDYQSLLEDLFSQLKPVGSLEQSLVEKIAITLWRQRRLVTAEAATLDLAINPRRIACEIEEGMGLSGFGDDKIDPDDLLPLDQEQIEQIDWCKSVIAEYDSVDPLTLDNMNKCAPVIFAQLTVDAKSEGMSIPEYLTTISLKEYILELTVWCRNKVSRLEKNKTRYPAVVSMSEMVMDKLSIPWDKLDLLNKYQTTLDNQLYKAARALREAQGWRLNSIEATDLHDDTTPIDTA